MVWINWHDRGTDAAFRLFEQEFPGYRIVTSFSTALTSGMGQQKLLTAIAGGDPPDLLMFDRFSVGEWAARGALESQQHYVDVSVEREDQAKAVLQALREGRPEDAPEPLGRIRESMAHFPGSRILTLVETIETGLAAVGESDALDALVALAEELLAHCDGVREEEFYVACWEEGSYGLDDERELFTVPNTTDSRALYYNVDLLERGGFVDEEGRVRPPRDWEELKEYAIALTEYDEHGNITQLGFAPNAGNSWLYLFGWINGGQFMSEDGRTCTLNDPLIVEALEYMVEIYDALGGVEKVDVFQSGTQSGGQDPFMAGKIAMLITVDINLRWIAETEPNLRFAVAPPPPPRGKESATWSGGFSWAIPKGSRNADEAFELIRFLSSERIWMYQAEVNSRYSSSRGQVFIPMMAPMPGINEKINERFVLSNPNIPPRIREYLPLFSEIMNISRYRPATPVGGLLWDEHVRAFERAVRHVYNPQEALDRGQAAVQAELDRLFLEVDYPKVKWSGVVVMFAVLILAVAGAIYLFGGRGELLHRWNRPESRAALFFAAPWLFGFSVLMLGPIAVSIVYSFCRYDILNPAEYVGFKNYTDLLTDPLFWKSLANTAYMMLGVPIGMAAGLGIAMLLNLNVRGMKVYRTVFYMPAIVPMVASSILWVWVLNPEGGLLNSLLKMGGVNNPPLWLHSPSWLLGSKAAIILMGLWGAGGGMIIWLAGLKGIPAHLYEAAEIDGAGPVGRFFHVTLPMLSPYIFFNLVMGIIGTMQIFAQAYIMTGGGPSDSTLFYAFYLFNNAFVYLKMGYASAMAWILLVIVCSLTVVQLVLSKKWVYYENE